MTQEHKHHHHQHHEPVAGDDTKESLSFQEKLVKRIEHWIDHNEEHVGNYRDWARRCGEKGFQEVVELLEETAGTAAGVGQKLEKILKTIKTSNKNP